jgi:VIT1/CCC1 family predicted Fe2+/Mn2+ transporter
MWHESTVVATTNVENDRARLAIAMAHTPAAIEQRLRAGPKHSYLRDFIYGAVDGAVTTFAVVSGVAGADLSAGVVIILGIANLCAEATRAEKQLLDSARRAEELHISLVPDGEREEVRQILQGKGFGGEDLERLVTVITKDKRQWVDMMLKEELGLSLHGPSPLRAACSTLFAFLVAGSLPILPFVIQVMMPISRPFLCSTVLTGFAFFMIGAAKARYTGRSWHWSGWETLGVGGGAAGLAYLAGLILKGMQ